MSLNSSRLSAGWLSESKARVFFDMHLPSWPGKGIAEKFDPSALAGAIADAGADSAVLYAKCQYGNFYTTVDGEKLHPGLGKMDLLVETASRLRARGVRTIAYYSVSWDERIADEHPEWLTENAAGARGDGPYRWRTLCINTPYAQVVKQHLAAIAAKPIDGIWLDMTIIGDGNCYCPACRARFRSATGREAPTDPSDPRFGEFLNFRYDLIESFYERMRAVVRAAAPEVAFTNNYWGYPQSSTGMGSRAIGSTLQGDFVTGEAYSDWSGIRSTSFLPIFLRGVAGGRPYEALIGSAINTWDYTRKPPAFLAYEAYALFAHGATVTVDDEPYHDGRFDQSFYRSVLAPIFRDISAHRESVSGTQLRYAAVYHSQSSKDGCARQSDFVRDVSGAFRLLRDLKLPVDFVFDESLSAGSLAELSVLVMPNVSHLSQGELAIIQEYITRGGLVIASGSIGGEAVTRSVEDVFGLHRGEQSKYSLSYLSLPGECDHEILVRGAYTEYSAVPFGQGCIVEPICETGPREFFHNNLPAPHRATSVPGLIVRTLGAGALALFPQPIFRHYAKEPLRELRGIIQRLLAHHAPAPLVELEIPMKMDYSVYRDGDTLYVHLLNPNMEPATCCGLMETLDGRFERSYEYMEEVVPVCDLGIRIRGRGCQGAEALREGSAVTVRALDDGARIDIPRVGLWEIVKIRLAEGKR